MADLRQQLLKKTATVNGVAFIGEVVEVSSADALKKLTFDLKTGLTENSTKYLAVLAANVEGKASVAVLVSDDLSATLQAPAIIKEHVAPLIKGGGGGQKTLATAGGRTRQPAPGDPPG
ncbi:DHHA1 domain-containing protein [Puia sp. P3]|uniref:DHHA1 domain-containing protein n=1 Tax=Puia sp. P3 TaxID=3423952 RepID=UPI003D67F77B